MKKDWMILESELDDDQRKVLNATINKSCVVSGCAGSGKSVIALIKAQHIQKECPDKKYTIIVYTKALRDYMNAGKKALGLSGPIRYYEEWERLSEEEKCCDYIIVDEIQDFAKEEIKEFINATKENFFFFGDTAQSIYSGFADKKRKGDTIPVDKICKEISIPEKFKPKNWELYRNYRLPLPVARVVQTVGIDLDAFDEGTYKSAETEIPRFLRYGSQDDQLYEIHKIIQERELTDVAILLPNNDLTKTTYDALIEMGGDYEVKYKIRDENSQDTLNFNPDNPKPNPKIMTYYNAKGLQFEAVFLPYIEKFHDKFYDKLRSALYVAMTRTYRYLYVMYTGNLPYPLSAIDRKLYKTTKTDEIADI